MKTLTAEDFLDAKGIRREPDVAMFFNSVAMLLDEYHEAKLKEAKGEIETFTIIVRNSNHDFALLRDELDKISPSFDIVNDEFVFCNADMPIFVRLTKHRDLLKESGILIVVTKRD